jgi:hypothetical protein
VAGAQARRCIELAYPEVNMHKTMMAAALTAALFRMDGAAAAESLETYDNFSKAPINGTLWSTAERSVAIKSKALQTTHRYWGSTADNTGSNSDSLRQDFQDPAAITAIAVSIKVNALEVDACTANSTTSQSRARIDGAFFNVGTPTPGSETGDMLSQARVYRVSSSTDPQGTLRVGGTVVQCTNSDCSAFNLIASVDLGTVNVGKATTLQMTWDQPDKQFLFSRDSGAETGTVPYTQDDSHAPGAPFKDLDTRLDIADCAGAKPLTGYVDATFDSVQVNK